MSKLFAKVCKLQIGGREINYPPMDMELDIKIAMTAVTTAEVKLYNPNEDTISEIAKIKNGVGSNVKIYAGYAEHHGVCVDGYITTFSVKKEHVDKIITFQVTDAGNQFDKTINKTYLNQSASSIVSDLISIVGANKDKIELGRTNVFYKSFTAKRYNDALASILADTESISYYQNGVLTIQPKTLTTKQKYGYLLSPSTGLINVPEKTIIETREGMKFQTLFIFNLYAGTIVRLDSKNVKGDYQIMTGKKKFSTFAKSECEWEAVQI